MRIKLTHDLKNEILLTLKNCNFEVTEDSELCRIFDISIRFFEVFKCSPIICIERQHKIELLHWLKQGYLETENSIFRKRVTPPTFLDIMKAASQVEDID